MHMKQILALRQDVVIMIVFTSQFDIFLSYLKDLWTDFVDIWYSDEVHKKQIVPNYSTGN